MPDFGKTVRQHVDTKTSDKFIGSQAHMFLFIAIPVVTPLECDSSVFQLQNAVVGNGNTMGIPSEIFNHTARNPW